MRYAAPAGVAAFALSHLGVPVIRRLSTTAVALGAAILLVLGGGAYTLAAAHSTSTISACVAHHGGALYKARHCAAHDRTLRWNVRGPRGPRGPQGPGDKLIYWAAAASSTPTPTTIGTALGVTYLASCIASGTDTEALIEIQTPREIYWDYSYVADTTPLGGSVDYPAGTYTTPNEWIGADASGSSQDTTTANAIQVKPVRGVLTLSVTANGTTTTPQCHTSIAFHPISSVSVVGTVHPAPAATHRPLGLVH